MTTLFPNASHFSVENLTQINQVAHSPKDVALDKLYAHVAGVALHTSSARVDAPKCHEETREAVQQDMLSWCGVFSPEGERRCVSSTGAANAAIDTPQAQKQMRNVAPINTPSWPELVGPEAKTLGVSVVLKRPTDILWLTGPAGAGKTAIMGTISDNLEKDERLAASFYFSSAMGAAGTTSKRLFVTTLAYQMSVHPRLKHRLGSLILEAVRENPAVFDMNMIRQLEVLILQPLRHRQHRQSPTSLPPMCILVDGVDECGGLGGRASSQARERDQIEVLSVLLKAAKDPTFPFRIVIASRPETWIRRYLADNAAGRVHEIFLDQRYSPDDDIRLFLKSKFAEKARRSGINSSAWPSQGDIERLVADASGQFIYASTVMRWVDTPGANPQAQLDAVLRLKIQPEAKSHPFAMLDALYASILNSTPDPDMAALWVRGVQLVQQVHNDLSYPPSTWTLNRLFESYEGQAEGILGGLPSLLYTVKGDTDFARWTQRPGQSPALNWPGIVGGESSYAFYHKSFVDYLEDDLRYGGSFPNLNEAKVRTWLGGRVSQTLKCCGSEVPIPESLVPTFRSCFLRIVVESTMKGCIVPDAKILSGCTPNMWFDVLQETPSVFWPGEIVYRALYIFVHSKCHPSIPCNRGCKRWRRAVSKLPNELWKEPKGRMPWTSVDLLRDRFCIMAPPSSLLLL